MSPPVRDPKNVQAWIIGSGVASLAAAVHLVKLAKVPANQIHLLESHHGTGGAMEISGNATDGYTLHAGAQPYFYEDCVKQLLSMVPSPKSADKSALEDINQHEWYTRPLDMAHTRAIKQDSEGIRKVDSHQSRIGAKLRMDLIRFIFDTERSLSSKRIDAIFDDSFFESEFWSLWSTTFFLQPWHSAIEFQRLLAKHLPNLHTQKDVHQLERPAVTLYESLIVPMTTFLEDEGVDFRFDTLVTDLKMYPASDPTTVSELVLVEGGTEKLITLDPVDIVIVTLGSLSTGMKTGTNHEPPSISTPLSLTGEWSLWQKLARSSSKFGNPDAFSTRVDESKVETFTVTCRSPEFLKNYTSIAKDKSGTGALVSVIESPWQLNISVLRQPGFASQSEVVDVIWGYGLQPGRTGKFVKKPMEKCSGEEILFELLCHLGFPTDQILSSATTIPCIVPLGSSMLLSCNHHDRPHVIPHETTNLGLVGQYVEIPGDTTLSVEYSVRGAALAVNTLMSSPHGPPKVLQNKLMEAAHLLW